MDINHIIPPLLGLAWLLPLASFALIFLFGPRMGRGGRYAALLATGAIATACLLSFTALGFWLWAHHPHAAHGGHGYDIGPRPISGEWYTLAEFGRLRLTISYYIDSLTLCMYCMVTLVATCIHVYSFGYMHEELSEVTDPLAVLGNGQPLRRRGRFHRFFQYLSLFCFSMLGLVIAGNVAMVFIFWELVGICSYLLIGFYRERQSACTAGNKAFIVNRVGDFGMIIGLMAIWTTLGTFSFGDYEALTGKDLAGISAQVRQSREKSGIIDRPDGMVQLTWNESVGPVHESSQHEMSGHGRQMAKWLVPARLWLLAPGRRRAGHFLRLRGQERPVPAARLAARRHGRPHARQRVDPRRHDGRGRRVSGRAVLSGLHARGAAGDRRASAASRSSWPRRSPSRPPTSSGCWPIRPSASWAT